MPGVSGRVLVVDDNKVIRQLIRVNLELEGFEVVTAADGAECLDVVHHVGPDVVTLDVVMPRLDGIRTAARLRADPRTRDVRIVVISACTQAEVESAVAAGVDAFLGKPFEPGELVKVVRRLAGPLEADTPDAPDADAPDADVPDAGAPRNQRREEGEEASAATRGTA
ncbi:response regulator [Streptomyces sp. NPDC026673]|uniref:response regulator n=1 Tax=Streptomyces sp. NPDC026673 TaxID=3155724 RepID=UPI0033CDA499